MAITEHYSASPVIYVCNFTYYIDRTLQEINERKWMMRWLSARRWLDLYESQFKSVLLVLKRFDFRAAPRWKARRFKAKT